MAIGTLSQPIQIKAELTAQASLVGSLALQASLVGNISVPKELECERYQGPYEVTPTTEAITLSTQNLKMNDNVTINPIPSNYGLITWDGSTLTVS